jgi:hypothetical protein
MIIEKKEGKEKEWTLFKKKDGYPAE